MPLTNLNKDTQKEPQIIERNWKKTEQELHEQKKKNRKDENTTDKSQWKGRQK